MATAGNDAIAIVQVHRLEVSTSATERLGYVLLLNIDVCPIGDKVELGTYYTVLLPIEDFFVKPLPE